MSIPMSAGMRRRAAASCGQLPPLGRREQPAEEAGQADEHRPVAVREDEVAGHDGDRRRRTNSAEHQHRQPRRALLGARAAPAACSATRRPTAPDAAVGGLGRRRRLVARPGAGRRHPAAGLALRGSHGASESTGPPAFERRTLGGRRSAASRPVAVGSVAADAGPRAGQLRQLRVQPRPVPRRARCRAGRPPQRRHRRRRRGGASSPTACWSPRARAGPRTPASSATPSPAFAERGHAGARRVPRPPGDRPRLRRDDRRRRPS